MNHDARVEPLIEDLLVEIAPSRAPDRLRTGIASLTSRARQRPRWLASIKEPPMRYRTHLVVGSPTLRLASVLAVASALLLALAGAIVVGATPPPGPEVVAPVRNGLIAFASNGDIWVTDLDDTARKQLTTGPSWDSSPTWSPQGDRIAYWTQRTPAAPFVLMVMDADGSNPMPVRDHLADDGLSVTDGLAPVWRPDGTQLAYPVNDGTNYWIESADLGSGQIHRLADGKYPAWSPDGTMLAFQGGPSQGEVWTMTADGTYPTRLASGYGPAWSSKGLIAYFRDMEPDQTDIWVMNTDGTGATRITNTARASTGRAGRQTVLAWRSSSTTARATSWSRLRTARDR